jgi:prepilin-type N-terminal cleavage/methylation domain-containing protein
MDASNLRPIRRNGFTVVELLVVIGIVAVLVAILMPAVIRARAQAKRIQCASNMRQWGIALTAYAADSKGSFPYNLDGAGMSWNGLTVQNFTNKYLTNVQDLATSQTTDGTPNVLFCPTAAYHIWYRAYAGITGSQLVGYFYLPYRALTGANYADGGDPNWVTKMKFSNNLAPNAPILTDMIQNIYGDWYDTQPPGAPPLSSHLLQNSNVPSGGNFLFEDGHVDWHAMSDVTQAASSSWNCFYYKININ